MAVTTENSRDQYTATAGQTVFPYTFEIFTDNDVAVIQNSSLFSKGTNYTVSGVGNDSGGNITLLVGAAAGDIITIYRDMELVRLNDYQQSGDFLANEVDDDFDRLWLALGQQQSTLARAIRASITDDVLNETNTVLPAPADRANKFIAFNSLGALIYSDGTSGFTGVESIKHINEFRTTGVTDVEALVLACQNAQTVYFGGTTLTIDSDFNYPADGICTSWYLQDCRINLVNNAQLLFGSEVDSFSVIGETAIIDGGLKRAQLTADFVPDGSNQVFQVADSSAFSVGDKIATSFDNNYMPNSSNRINNPPTQPLTDFPTVIATTPTSITVKIPGVTNQAIPAGRPTIPTGAELLNTRFDKRNLSFVGTGRFIFSGLTIQNTSNAYPIRVFDNTESANVIVQNIEIIDSALDVASFRCRSVEMNNYTFLRLVDIGKQHIVWSNETELGDFRMVNCDVRINDKDSFFLASPVDTTTVTVPNIYLENCYFDGSSVKPLPKENVNALDSFNWLTFFGADTVTLGKFKAVNCDFKYITRAIYGSTVAPPTTMTYDNIIYENCELDCDGFYSDGVTTANEPEVTYINSRVRANNFRFSVGSIYPVCINTEVTENFPTESSDFFTDTTTITRQYRRAEYIQDSSNNNKYQVIDLTAFPGESLTDAATFQRITTDIGSGIFTDGSKLIGELDVTGARAVMESVRLPKRDASNETKIRFLSDYSADTSVILEGVDNTSSTFPDTDDWFNIADSLNSPPVKFRFDLTTVSGEIGGGESSGDKFHINLINARNDATVGNTAPLSVTGAFAYRPPTGSLVTGARDRQTRVTTGLATFTVTANTLTGASTITGTVGSADVGDWISHNIPGNATVNFYEITNISGSDYTIRPVLKSDVTIGDNAARIKSEVQGAAQAVSIYSGEVDSAGVSVSLPSGWSCVRNSVGNFTITHNIGSTSYSFVASTRSGGGIVRNANPANANSVNYTVLNTSGAAVDNDVTFILKEH